MLDIVKVKDLIDDICFELDIKHYKFFHENIANTTKLRDWYDEVKLKYKDSIEGNEYLSEKTETLDKILSDHEEKPVPNIPTEVLKNVYVQLVDGVLAAKTTRDEDGYYKLEDGELTDVPDMPNSNINNVRRSACSAHFIKGMVEKYKPNAPNELYDLFDKVTE